jgi:hypothetical protein
MPHPHKVVFCASELLYVCVEWCEIDMKVITAVAICRIWSRRTRKQQAIHIRTHKKAPACLSAIRLSLSIAIDIVQNRIGDSDRCSCRSHVKADHERRHTGHSGAACHCVCT